VDAVTFSTFRALGFEVEVRPALKPDRDIYGWIGDEEKYTFEEWAEKTTILGNRFAPMGEVDIDLRLGWDWMRVSLFPVSPVTYVDIRY
jgi:hypothetical protein